MPNLTMEELEHLKTLINREKQLADKFKQASADTSDPQLKGQFQQISAAHKEHYSKLISHLG